jgi:hypothetical protein
MALVEAGDELVKDGLLGNNLGRLVGPSQSTNVGIDAYDDAIVSMKPSVCFVVVEHSRPEVLSRIFATLDTSWEEFIEKLYRSARPENLQSCIEESKVLAALVLTGMLSPSIKTNRNLSQS